MKELNDYPYDTLPISPSRASLQCLNRLGFLFIDRWKNKFRKEYKTYRKSLEYCVSPLRFLFLLPTRLADQRGFLAHCSSQFFRQMVTSFFQKAYYLFLKSILPFFKELTSFWRRGRILEFLLLLICPLKQCLNAV